MAKKPQKLQLTAEVQAAIDEAVRAGLQAGRIQGAGPVEDPYKATEKRLYSYPTLKEKILADREKIVRLRIQDAPERSRGIVRFSRPGYRVGPEEMLEAMISNIEADIAVDTEEVATIDNALKYIAGDEYAEVIPMLYFMGRTPEEIAEDLHCEKTTVFRNRKRLVNRLAVRLYGADAVR